MRKLGTCYPNYIRSMYIGSPDINTDLVSDNENSIVHSIDGTFFGNAIEDLSALLESKTNGVFLTLITSKNNYEAVRTTSESILYDFEEDKWTDFISDLLVDHFFDPYFSSF